MSPGDQGKGAPGDGLAGQPTNPPHPGLSFQVSSGIAIFLLEGEPFPVRDGEVLWVWHGKGALVLVLTFMKVGPSLYLVLPWQEREGAGQR